mgnify:FL=1
MQKVQWKMGEQEQLLERKQKQGRTIAVDKRKIKLGSKVQINGKTYVAEDVGGGVKGKHIDVFFKSHKQTKRFGKKTRC